MKKTTSIKNLAAGMRIFHNKVGTIRKDAKNPFFKSTFASLSNIQDGIHLPLQDAGLTYVQFPEREHELTTVLIHVESGEFMQATYSMKPVKDDPQGLGSTITYQRRYALCAILGLNIGEDDDGNKGSNLKVGAATAPQSNGQKYPDDNRPWLQENQLNVVLKRNEAGEHDVVKKTLDAFRMKKEYRDKLEAILASRST